jgi:aminoglycoside phosphotransferase (APT) family kinase protein
VTAIGKMTPLNVPMWLIETFATGSIDRAVRLGWGFRNDTWRVDLKDGRCLAVTRPSDSLAAPAVVALTRLIQPRLRAAGIASPSIVDLAPGDGSTVFATEFIEGTSGAEMLAQDGGPALIGGLLGDAWRRLRSIDPTRLPLPDAWAAPRRLTDLSRARLSWAEGWLTRMEQRLAAAAIGALPELLAGRRPGFVHGDLVPANVLVRDGSLTAILDFEFVRLADPLLDAAWFDQIVAFHHPSEEPAAWQAFVSAAGIDADDPGTGDLLRALPLVRLLEILDSDDHAEGAAHWLSILRACIARMA